VTAAQRDLAIRVAAALVATVVLAPIAGLALPRIMFHRVLTRTFMASLVIAFLARRWQPRRWFEQARAAGLRGPGRLSRAGAGFTVAVVLFALTLAVSWALGGRQGAVARDSMSWAQHLLVAVATAAVVSFFEEWLFRGYLHDVIGGLGSAVVYAAVHNFRPVGATAPAGDTYRPLFALERAPELLGRWGEPREALLTLLGLFLFGLALNRLRERTGTLYLGIGVHAGLVFAINYYRRFLDGLPVRDPWLHGGTRLHDGVLGVVMLVLLLAAARRAPLPKRWARETPGGAGAT